MDVEAMWHPLGFEWAPKNPKMEITCIPRLTLVSGIPTGEGSSNIDTFMRIFPEGKHLPKQETQVDSTLL